MSSVTMLDDVNDQITEKVHRELRTKDKPSSKLELLSGMSVNTQGMRVRPRMTRKQMTHIPQDIENVKPPNNIRHDNNLDLPAYTPTQVSDIFSKVKSLHVRNCIDIAEHIKYCPVCSKFYDFDKTPYIIIIILLTIMSIILARKHIN